jgi:hypothetical protein
MTEERGEIELAPLGQPPTLAGFVEPSALDARRDHRPHEDPTWLEWDPTEEHDGTDPNDLDFLFGLLVREVGVVERRQSISSTYVLALSMLPWPRWARALAAIHRRWWQRPSTALADAYTALHSAGHHLLQYFGWLAGLGDDLLTQRAYPPELARVAQGVVVANQLQGQSRRRMEPSPTNRIHWLSQFVRSTRSRGRRGLRRVGWAVVSVGILLGVAWAVKDAVEFQPPLENEFLDQGELKESSGD